MLTVLVMALLHAILGPDDVMTRKDPSNKGPADGGLCGPAEGLAVNAIQALMEILSRPLPSLCAEGRHLPTGRA